MIEEEIAETPRPPREAPERGRAKKDAGKQRRLDAQWADRARGQRAMEEIRSMMC